MPSSSSPHEAMSPPPPPLSSPPPTTPSSSLSSCSSSSSSSSSSCCTHRKKLQGYTTPSTYQDQIHPASPSLKTKMKAKTKRKMISSHSSPHTTPRQGSNSNSITSSFPTSPVMVAGGAKPIPLSSPTSSSAVASSSLSPPSSPHLLSSIAKKIPALPLFSLYEHEADDDDDLDANNNDGKRNKKGGDGSNNIINKNNKSTGPTTQEETKKKEVEYDFDNDCVYCSSSSALPVAASGDDDDDSDDDAMDKNQQLQQQQQQGKVVTFGDRIMTTTTIAEEEEQEEEVSVASSSSRNKRQRRSRICMTRIWLCLRHISCIRKLTTNFWRYLPSVLVTKAFWLSLMTLGLCDLAKIIIVSKNSDNADADVNNAMDDNNKEEITMTFGLWTYSELTNVGNSSSSDDNGGTGISDSGADGTGGGGGGGDGYDTNMGDYSTPNDNNDDDNDDYSFYDSNNPIIKEVDRVAACHLHLGHTDSSHMFFMDPKFRTARAFGVIAVGVGFLSMVALWLGAMRSRGANSVRWRKGVGLCLILCCAFEGLTLLILRAGVCSSGGGVGHGKDKDEVYRDCSIAEGSATIISACTFWLLTGLAMVKLPPADPEEEGGEEEEEERRRRTSGEDQEQEEEADFGPYVKRNIASLLRRRFFSRWSWRKWTLLRQTSYASEMVEIDPGTRSPPSYDSWSEDESIELA